MKHLSIGIGLLAVLLAGSLLTLWYTVQYLDDTEQPLRDLIPYLDTGNYSDMLPLIEESQRCWESHRGYFCSLFSHTELEDVEQTFAALKAYAEQEELAELRDAHTRLLAMLEHLRNMDKPYYYNILTVFRKA